VVLKVFKREGKETLAKAKKKHIGEKIREKKQTSRG